MAEALQRKSALQGRYNEGLLNCPDADAAGIRLFERRGLSIIQFDGRRDDAKFLKAAGKAVGFDLPEGTGASSESGGRTVLWTGPNRYLLVAGDALRSELIQDLAKGLKGRHHSILDLGQARAVFRLSGSALRALMSKGTTIDLHPRAFPVGSVAVTQLAHVGAVIHHESEDSFDVYVFRSFARHLWEWFQEAGEEYGLSIEAPR